MNRRISPVAVGGGRHRALLQSLSENEDIDLLAAEDEAHGKVVLSTTEVKGKGQPKVLGGPEALKLSGSKGGRTFVPIPQGCCAASRYEVDGLESFAVVATEVAGQGARSPRNPLTKMANGSISADRRARSQACRSPAS